MSVKQSNVNDMMAAMPYPLIKEMPQFQRMKEGRLSKEEYQGHVLKDMKYIIKGITNLGKSTFVDRVISQLLHRGIEVLRVDEVIQHHLFQEGYLHRGVIQCFKELCVQPRAVASFVAALTDKKISVLQELIVRHCKTQNKELLDVCQQLISGVFNNLMPITLAFNHTANASQRYDELKEQLITTALEGSTPLAYRCTRLHLYLAH